MRLVGPEFLERVPGRVINTHPALSPAFPGMHGPRDALDYGVKVTGCTIFVVDEGVDTGPIVAQAAVPVLDDDTESSLHERIKEQERNCSCRPWPTWSPAVPHRRKKGRLVVTQRPDSPCPDQRLRQDRPGRARAGIARRRA